jgi:hypothetical protein
MKLAFFTIGACAAVSALLPPPTPVIVYSDEGCDDSLVWQVALPASENLRLGELRHWQSNDATFIAPHISLHCIADSIELTVGFATLKTRSPPTGPRRRRAAGLVAVSKDRATRIALSRLEHSASLPSCGQACVTVVINSRMLPFLGRQDLEECTLHWTGPSMTTRLSLNNSDAFTVFYGDGDPGVEVQQQSVTAASSAQMLLEAQQQPLTPPPPPPAMRPPPHSDALAGHKAGPGPHRVPRSYEPSPALVKSGLLDGAGVCLPATIALSRCVHQEGSAAACKSEQRDYMRCQRQKLVTSSRTPGSESGTRGSLDSSWEGGAQREDTTDYSPKATLGASGGSSAFGSAAVTSGDGSAPAAQTELRFSQAQHSASGSLAASAAVDARSQVSLEQRS